MILVAMLLLVCPTKYSIASATMKQTEGFALASRPGRVMVRSPASRPPPPGGKNSSKMRVPKRQPWRGWSPERDCPGRRRQK